jgi:hypothetical protein
VSARADEHGESSPQPSSSPRRWPDKASDSQTTPFQATVTGQMGTTLAAT